MGIVALTFGTWISEFVVRISLALYRSTSALPNRDLTESIRGQLSVVRARFLRKPALPRRSIAFPLSFFSSPYSP